MAKILRPGTNDADYAAMLSQGVPVSLTKVKKNGDSNLGVGTVKSGLLAEPITKGKPAVFNEKDQGNTSEVQKILVDEDGRIRIQTATSIYEVLSCAPHRQASLLYLRRGYLDFDETMPDGFYDGGRFLEFEEDENGKFQPLPPSNREIIVMDIRKDAGLKRKFEMAQKMLQGISGMKERILMLAQFVSNVMGGIQVVGNSTTHSSDEEIQTWIKTQGNILLPGYLNNGVCRHRSLIFKYMADRLGIRSRLIRGDTSGAHVWNVVEIHSELFVIDVMQNPFELIPIDDERAAVYKRTGAKGIPRGTVGGRSIPIT